MMSSTRLFFRLIRPRLALGMGAAFALFLFISLIDPPFDAEYRPLLILIGFGLALLMRLHTLLSFTMFPVTDRQVAWIPLAAWGLVSIAGLAGLLTGQALGLAMGGFSLAAVTAYWSASIQASISVLFLLLLMWRSVRFNSGAIGFMGFIPALLFNPGRGGIISPEQAAAFYAGWPFWAVGCLFLIWEAPRQTAMLRRFEYAEESGFFKSRIAQLNAPARLTWPTRLANGLAGVFLLVIGSLFLFYLVFEPIKSIRKDPFQLFFLFLLLIPLSWLQTGWRQIRASGLGPWRGAAVLLVEMTGAGYAFRDLLGVRRGAVVRCRFCGGWRLAWQAECPHCGDRQPGVEAQPEAQQSALGSLLWPRHDPGAMFYRGMIPTYLLFMIIFMNLKHWLGG